MISANNSTALALSGGGARAMAFHSGVLKYMAEKGQLEGISQLSTVSGGSLLAGLVFANSGMKWPSSPDYLAMTLPAVRGILTQADLQRELLKRLFLPENWKFVLSRANIVADAIRDRWNIHAKLDELPNAPIWSINGATAETGKRFRFKKLDLGDYELGYARSDDFPLASAMAVSAAFPVGIGPLSIDATALQWEKRPEWDAAESEKQPVTPAYKRLHIYDGGVYDNLGLESFYDLGKRCSKGGYRIISSDAGAPLTRGFDLFAINPFRLKRLMDIVTDQNRALRVRAFVDYLKSGNRGAYIGIGMSPRKQLAGLAKGAGVDQYDWLTDDQIEVASAYPTDLHSMTPDAFDLICRHGYETACFNDAVHSCIC